MSMPAQSKPMTADELLALPEDHRRHELVRGELTSMSPSAADHSNFASKILIEIGIYLKSHPLGRVFGADGGFVVERDPDTVRVPDVSFVARDRYERLHVPRKYFPGYPDLAVEVVSPTDRRSDVEAKARMWIDAGATSVWIVWPDEATIDVLNQDGSRASYSDRDEVPGEPLLPGFRLKVADVFA